MCAASAQVLGKSWKHNKSEYQILQYVYDVLFFKRVKAKEVTEVKKTWSFCLAKT